MTAPARLPTARVAQLDEVAGPIPWLIHSLWSEQAVGFVAGTPKSCKSWLGLDLAISVASNTPCLDRFQVEQPGRSLVFLAEDSLPQVRRRIQGIASAGVVGRAELELLRADYRRLFRQVRVIRVAPVLPTIQLLQQLTILTYSMI